MVCSGKYSKYNRIIPVLRLATHPLKMPPLKALALLTIHQLLTTEKATMTEKTFVEEIEKAIQKSKGLNINELLFSHQGTLYPTTVCSAETFQALENFESRKDDLVLVSYPKCGVNWLIQILNELIATTLTTKPENTELPFIECGDPEKYERMKQFPSPRIVATHLHYNHIPKSIFKNKAKVLVLFRNPKDTAASFFHFHNNAPSVPSYNSWEDFFLQFINGQVAWGSYFDQAVAWNKHIDDENILILTYEELKEDLVAGVKQIAEFFGFMVTAEQIQVIADRASFEAVQERSQETHGAVGPLLFRKGVVGDWKNLFDETQNQEMDAKFKECLAGTKLGTKLKYEVYCKA
ncbi:sulfotransferase 6B1 isoform X2 [Sceloporus undulatus]|uniref:sulfotransferase 6B1 isoform X2 n=1 Tax=Sceloporus undulatus TaxID=8520 RepID=UPI001C4BD516|nr:sulfotransferase 6B1 isoform X2 [Sceloporus undulatus]